MHGTDGGTLHLEDLAVRDGLLVLIRRVFVDGLVKIGIEPDEVGHPTGVVTVPVGEEHMGETNRGCG
jgi:hypothetical protein